MKKNVNKKRPIYENTDWIYDPIVIKGIVKSKKEAEELLKKGEHLKSFEELVEEFQKEDEK